MIEIKGLSADYGKAEVLKDFSLNIEKGKLISLIGTNGSGKSTLLKTIAGIISPGSGEISLSINPIFRPEYGVK